jgi:hypothetical protein
MSIKLDGTNPLSYMGVKPVTPPQQVTKTRRPTVNDYQGIEIGTQWLIPHSNVGVSEEVWVLTGKANNIAIWTQLSTGTGATYPNHEVLVGTGAANINTIPTGTTGHAMVSGGAGSDPVFNVLGVVGGGSGVAANVAFTPLCGGTNTTNPIQSVASIGVLGQVLTSNGAGALPTFEDAVFGVPVTVPDGGTGVIAVPAYEVVCGGVTNVDPLQTVGSLGTAGQVLTSQGAASLPHWVTNSTSGGVVVTAHTAAGAGNHTLHANAQMIELFMWNAGGTGHTLSSTGGARAGAFCHYSAPALFFGGGGSVVAYVVGAPAVNTGNPSTFGGISAPTSLTDTGNNTLTNATGLGYMGNIGIGVLPVGWFHGTSIAGRGGGGVGGAGESLYYANGAVAVAGGAPGLPGQGGSVVTGGMFGGAGGGEGQGAGNVGGAGGKPGGGGGNGTTSGGVGGDGAIYVVEYLG